MPIIFAKAPANAARLLCINLRDLVLAARVPPGVPVMRLEDLAHTDPHPVFVVGLSDLVEGRLLSAAAQTGWRYLLVQDGAAIAETELVPKQGAGGKASKDLQLGALTTGPFTGATIEALSAAERLPLVRKAEYEGRFLKIPAVYFAALWLHGGDEDILIPMVDPPGGLRPNHPYSEAKVLAALREVAEQNKSFHDSHDAKSKSSRKPRRRGK